jgi:hypothetical protein
MDRYLDYKVRPGKLTTFDHMQSVTVSIPADDYEKLLGDEIETLYLRPMVKALGIKINSFGPVRAAELPIPEGEMAWSCTKGRIPVLLRIVRRTSPDRYQILIHALVEPTRDTTDCAGDCAGDCDCNCDCNSSCKCEK